MRTPPPGPLLPVPDAIVLPTRLPLPAAGPPFDDQASANRASENRASASLPARHAVIPPGAATAASARQGGSAGQAGPAGRARQEPPGSEWVAQFAQALVEALAGSRPARQMTPWTTEQVRRRIQQIGSVLQTGHRPVVRRVLTSAPRRDVIEMTVIVGVGPRVRAIAVRLERARLDPAYPGQSRPWRCTVIQAA
ncbi:MAG: Rv3235 family protein [Streptosporangiaceae bacterium]